MKDANRDSSNDSHFKRKKYLKMKTYNQDNMNNLKQINKPYNIDTKNESKNTIQNSNNICTLTLMTSNNNQTDENNFNFFNKNNQMNITQQINLHNTNLQNAENNNKNNNNFSFNLFNENSNFLNNSLFSFQSNNFNNLNIEELETKNEKMILDIINQDKNVKKLQQLHINSMCELIKNEINTFQQYQQEQIDITTYIDSMQNIIKTQNNQYTDLYNQLEKLNYMIKQQIKLSNLIEQMKQNDNNKSNLSENLLGNSLSLTEDQNAINLKNLQNIQSQIDIFKRGNEFL